MEMVGDLQTSFSGWTVAIGLSPLRFSSYYIHPHNTDDNIPLWLTGALQPLTAFQFLVDCKEKLS